MLRFLLVLALFAWALRSLIVAPFNIPSGSMLPPLIVGDYLIVSKWPYGYSRYSFPFALPPIEGRLFAHLPSRGDVVVFRYPGENEDLVKRVIGLPGDIIEVKGGVFVLNGQPVPREQLDRRVPADQPQQPMPGRGALRYGARAHPRWTPRLYVSPLSRDTAGRTGL